MDVGRHRCVQHQCMWGICMKQEVQQCHACTRPLKAAADMVHLVASLALIDGLEQLWYEGLQGGVLTCSKTQPLESDVACA